MATDHPLKRLVALAPEDFAAWLLGQDVHHVTLRQGELTAEPIDADLVMDVTLWNDQALILHLEFQGPGSHRPMPLRVLDDQTRFALTAREVPVHSVVISLAGAGATDTGVHQLLDATGQPRVRWQYTVIRLWQLPAEALVALQRPALLALVGQTRIDQPAQVIPQVLAQMGQHTHGEQRERLLSEL